MKRILTVLAVVLAIGPLRAETITLNGWVSDSMCGAKHVGDNPDCVKKCVESMGAKPVFVDSDKKLVWSIDNPDAVKFLLGNHVKVTVVLDEAKKSVHIDTVEALK